MFKKKECENCGKKINEKYDFCPNCGNQFNRNTKEENWGMLGREDSIPQFNEIKFPRGMNMLFNSLMKNLNKQFEEMNKDVIKKQKNLPNKENHLNKNIKRGGISISISTSGNTPPEIKVNSFGNRPRLEQEQIKKQMPNNLSKEDLKKLATLPKQEPITNIRRLSNKVVYEIDMPGVESIKNISIIKLENSIEIKAIAKDKIYTKLIPINLPITNYNLSKGKLILELSVKG